MALRSILLSEADVRFVCATNRDLAASVRERHLREAFSFHSLLVGGNPFTASSIYTLIHFLERKWGVHFPKGGTHALVRAMVKLFSPSTRTPMFSSIGRLPDSGTGLPR